MTDNSAIHRARARFVLVGVVVPLLATIVGIVLMLAWLPQLPDPVAVHWGANGEPNGFASPWLTIAMTAAIGVGLTAVLALPVLLASRRGEWGPSMRFLGALSGGGTVFLVGLMTWSLGMQRGLADAHDAESVLPALAVGLGAGVLVGVAAWFAQPNVAVSGGEHATGAAPATMTLAPGERAAWLRTVTMPRGGMIAIVAVTVVFAVTAVWLAFTSGELAGVFALLALLFVVLLLATSVFRARVDDTGLTVRSALGIPSWRIPLEDVETVTVAAIDPMTQFGGWGVRAGLDGRFGVVLRRGDAIQVARAGKRTFVVTVDDAVTGAALLEALAERARKNTGADRA